MGKLWKIYKILATAFVTILIIDCAVVAFFAFYRPAITKADAIVVLGAAINTPALYNRSLEGLRMYEQGKGDVMVLSGGRISDKDISEAGYMQKVIESKAKDPVPIILEDQSHSTYENISNSKNKIPQARSLIVVSDDFHLARAVLTALRKGFYPVYWSSPKPVYYKTSELAYYFMREVMAMLAYVPKFVMG